MRIPDELATLLHEQHGLVTTAQLELLGVTRSARRHACARNGWRLVLPGVVATLRGPLWPRQRLVAAQLWAGDDAVIAARTAAACHGVKAADGEHVVRILVPAHRFLRTQGFVVVRRTRRPDPRPWSRPPFMLSSPARAVVDAAREARTLDDARAIVLEAVQRRIVPVEALRHELEDGPRQGSAFARRAVQDAEAGAWSVPEVKLASALARSTVLPPVLLNPDLVTPDGTTLPRPDGWVDDVGLAIQVHSKQHHSHVDDWEATVLSDGVYAEHGIPVVGLTPRFFAADPAAAVRRIEKAYLARAGLPRPDVVATAIGHGLVS
ncbi:hypothetical protein [Kineosporia sp. A_224]|uniref:hypothetical protein n=1 Tax=Kineosporia sp. A_224 TaxID=1962180 RepID=UPI0013046E07|nr:hypothetical protein [Kineosporia sp. A_224]